MINEIKMSKLSPQSGITKFNTLDLTYQLFQEDNGLDDENKIADTLILFIAGHETTGTYLFFISLPLQRPLSLGPCTFSLITSKYKKNFVLKLSTLYKETTSLLTTLKKFVLIKENLFSHFEFFLVALSLKSN